jgi:hypothetical protein
MFWHPSLGFPSSAAVTKTCFIVIKSRPGLLGLATSTKGTVFGLVSKRKSACSFKKVERLMKMKVVQVVLQG